MFFPSKFFNKKEEKRIIAAIEEAEMKTSGEIKVHVQKQLETTIYNDAIAAFHKLEMNETKLKNGVLFFLVPGKKQFAIIGDTGINSKVPENFWKDVRDLMRSHFEKNKLADGVCAGIQKAGEQLKSFFPRQDDDKNELPDTITYS